MNHARTGSAPTIRAFFRNLAVGEPTILPEPWCDRVITSIAPTVAVVKGELGAQIALRTFNGKVWACRIATEQVKKAAV